MKTPSCSPTKIIGTSLIIGCTSLNLVSSWRKLPGVILVICSLHLLYLTLLSNITETSNPSVGSRCGKWEMYKSTQTSNNSQHRDEKCMWLTALMLSKCPPSFSKSIGCPLSVQKKVTSIELSWRALQLRTMLSPTVNSIFLGVSSILVGSWNKELGTFRWKSTYSARPKQ